MVRARVMPLEVRFTSSHWLPLLKWEPPVLMPLGLMSFSKVLFIKYSSFFEVSS